MLFLVAIETFFSAKAGDSVHVSLPDVVVLTNGEKAFTEWFCWPLGRSKLKAGRCEFSQERF